MSIPSQGEPLNNRLVVEKKAKRRLGGYKPVIEEDESWDIKQDDPDDRTCGETKEVEESEKERLKSKRKPVDLEKICNLVRMVKGLMVFVENFTYKCDFVVLEDTTSVIDHYLRSMVLGKPFVKASGLVYDKGEGMIMFGKDNERITFKMPHKWKDAEDGVRIFPYGVTNPAT
nr:protein kinase-like domain, concanavalin A-like lectin/glucanase domain protein [Tanacetum cinerariifolium]